MNKHAYLILAHNQFDILKKLVVALDSKHNDIYIHVDKKAKDFDEHEFSMLTKFSKVFFIKRKSLNWGNYNLVETELRLMKSALNQKYSYYHLLSGQDLPIKNSDYIYHFFEKEKKDFMSWGEDLTAWDRRFKAYRFFMGTKNKPKKKFAKFLVKVQLKLGVNRVKKSKITYLKGDQWFSITDSLCKYIISKEKFIKKWFKHTECPDETVMQSIAYISPFKENMTNNSLRYIDWSAGGSHPKTLSNEDKIKLEKTDKLFARKFDEKESKELIESILNKIK